MRATSAWSTGRFDLDYGACEGIIAPQALLENVFEKRDKALI